VVVVFVVNLGGAALAQWNFLCGVIHFPDRKNKEYESKLAGIGTWGKVARCLLIIWLIQQTATTSGVDPSFAQSMVLS
jgi:hypothetical protein